VLVAGVTPDSKSDGILPQMRTKIINIRISNRFTVREKTEYIERLVAENPELKPKKLRAIAAEQMLGARPVVTDDE
jgi:hypothetical protein